MQSLQKRLAAKGGQARPCLSQTGCYENSALFEGKTSDGSNSCREKRDYHYADIATKTKGLRI